jgi:PBP1b-binding outer membrane lipoprotein LpoB
MYRNDGASKPSRMEGAKFRIIGTIGTIIKQNRDLKDIYYIFTLNLVNNESGIIEWSDEKEIVKFVSTR